VGTSASVPYGRPALRQTQKRLNAAFVSSLL